MCGRFVRKRNTTEIAQRFRVDEIAADLQPSFNIAPTHDVAVVTNRGTRRLVAMRWGLVPRWSTDLGIGSKLINARAESLMAKSAFRESFKYRRCLVVADAFYEWLKAGRTRTPVLLRLKSDKPFAFAGLYDVWCPPTGDPIRTCSIVTTEPNALVQPIHDRMPVILEKGAEDFWLDETVTDHYRLLDLLQPYPADEMEAYTVSSTVNSVNNDSPACIEPAVTTEQRSLF